MPRVSDEHIAMRRDQILDAAHLCFSRKGFHQASMQDVIRESGLSAGAIYSYFKSKNDIIAALADRLAGSFDQLLGQISTEDPLPSLAEIMGRAAVAVVAQAGPDGPARLAPHAWSAALASPELAASIRGPMTNLRAILTGVAQRMKDDGRLPADADPAAVGATLLCLMPGFVIQYLILGDVDADTIQRGLRALFNPAQ
ncbi:MAG TPA: TetR/AcrR family transcriptional regulator [Pseudonocardiaceae bacterium]|jgi:AcrR family transcriptional regulator|nr:TetR/AcrR family transcriptional regulator [Pseudonocardiaceae bacterium]